MLELWSSVRMMMLAMTMMVVMVLALEEGTAFAGDSNKDGVTDERDFTDALVKINSLHHWEKNDENYSIAKETLNGIWEGLKTAADKNKDGILTQEEWINMWTKTVQNVKAGQAFPGWQQLFIELMFNATDTSGDGFIDRGEYVTIQTMFGINESESNKAFDKLFEDTKKGLISKAYYKNLWNENFLSTESQGYFLFGLPTPVIPDHRPGNPSPSP